MNNRLIFIDPESPGPGGGIRTYLLEASKVMLNQGFSIQIFSHQPDFFFQLKCTIIKIGRLKILFPGLRRIGYKKFYDLIVILEFSKWISNFLKNSSSENTVIEFADFQAYAFYSLLVPKLRRHCVIRVHTPGYLISADLSPLIQKKTLHTFLAGICERICLLICKHISIPSQRFVYEQMPSLRRGVYMSNPINMSLQRSHQPLIQHEKIAPNFLYLGRIEPRKGLHFLIKAFVCLLSENKNAKLVLAGACPDIIYLRKLESLRDLLKSPIRNQIQFQDAVPRSGLETLFSSASYLIIPSLWENCPYVYFEGIRRGLLVLHSETGEMAEFENNFRYTMEKTNQFENSFQPNSSEALLMALRSVPSSEKEYHQIVKHRQRYLTEFQKSLPPKMNRYYCEIADS